MSKVKHWTETKLAHMDPCSEGLRFARRHKSLAAAWKACKRGDFMLWYIKETIPRDASLEDRRGLVGVAVDCARLALPHAGKWRKEIEKGLAVLDRYVAGEEVSLREIVDARTALWAARQVAVWAAVWAAEVAAWAAGEAAGEAAWAAGEAASNRARLKTFAKVATIVRKHFPTAPKRGAR